MSLFAVDDDDVTFDLATLAAVNPLLDQAHYLGPIDSARLVVAGFRSGHPVAAQVWRPPTSRRLPADGTWLELSRWCLTPAAGPNAGSRMHRWAVRRLRETFPKLTTLVSYSDPSVGHTGALYRACNWQWAPTWQRLRPPPSAGGSWDGVTTEAVKDRWVFPLRRDRVRGSFLVIDDLGAVRAWVAAGGDRSRLAYVAG